MNNIQKAIFYANIKHEGQVRKYYGLPYISHPLTVAHIVAKHGGTENMIIASILHDCIEDCNVTKEEIARLFGDDVAYLVDGLSHTTVGNRAQRKHETNLKLGACDSRVKTIKIADNLHNLGSVMKYDPKFAITYLKEAMVMSEYLADGNQVLFKKWIRVLSSAKKRFDLYENT